jgi:hypothetical protein
MRIFWVLAMVAGFSLACGGGEETDTKKTKAAKKAAKKFERKIKKAAKKVAKRSKCLQKCEDLKGKADNMSKRGKYVKGAKMHGEALKCQSRCEAGGKGRKGKGTRNNEAGCMSGCQTIMVKAAKQAKRKNYKKYNALKSKAYLCAARCRQ